MAYCLLINQIGNIVDYYLLFQRYTGLSYLGQIINSTTGIFVIRLYIF